MRAVVGTSLVLALLATAGCGSEHRARPAQRAPTTHAGPAGRTGCSTGTNPSNEVVLCAQAVDTLRARHTGPLRVQLIDVITALQQAAAHAGSLRRAVGSSCAPPARGDGLGRPWPCQVSYQGAPAITVGYRLTVHANGCWSATPVVASGGARGIAHRLGACGLPVR